MIATLKYTKAVQIWGKNWDLIFRVCLKIKNVSIRYAATVANRTNECR